MSKYCFKKLELQFDANENIVNVFCERLKLITDTETGEKHIIERWRTPINIYNKDIVQECSRDGATLDSDTIKFIENILKPIVERLRELYQLPPQISD